MNAVILAGGYGSRLKPLTEAVPKPMLTVCNRPMIDYCVAQLYHYGVRDMTFALSYLPEKIIEWAIGYTGVSCHFSVEDMPLGTLGGVKAAAEYLDDTFVVLSGDGLSDIDLNKMLGAHLSSGALLTAAVKRVPDPRLYGVAKLGARGAISHFVEKPHGITEPAYVNCGTYIASKRILNYVPLSNCDFARDLFPLLVDEGRLAYYEHKGYWRDVGDFSSYYRANFDMLSSTFYPFVKNFNAGDYSSRLFGGLNPSLAADTAVIDGHAANCIIGRSATVERSGRLENCIVADGVTVKGQHNGCIITVSGSIQIPGHNGNISQYDNAVQYDNKSQSDIQAGFADKRI